MLHSVTRKRRFHQKSPTRSPEDPKNHDLGEMELEYFRIHIHCDDDQALTMRKILERETRHSPKQRRLAKKAGFRLIKAGIGFFMGITDVTLPSD